MKRSAWNDEHVEHLLKLMPTIKDNRSPHDIYQNISSKVMKKQKKVWVVPAFASVAAVLLLILISPSLLNVKDQMISMDSEKKAEVGIAGNAKMNKSEPESTALVAPKGKEGNAAEARTFDALAQPQGYAIYADEFDPNLQEVVTFGVGVEGSQFLTSVSVIVDKNDQSVLKRMDMIAPQLNDVITRSNWGIEPYPTGIFKLSEIENQDGTVDVKAEFPTGYNTEGFTSAMLAQVTNAFESLKFSSTNYKEVELYQDDKQGVVMGQSGYITKVLPLKDDKKQAYMYYMKEDSGFKVLIPSFEEFTKIEDALSFMKIPYEKDSFKLHPPITNSASIETVNENGKDVEIIFTDDADLANDDSFILAIDAIMLTAKEFGFETVTFKGNIDQIGKVRFNEPVPVPIAPNLIYLQ